MYSIKFPDYNLEDFLDEMLSNKHGETYNFLKGRLLAIKNILIEKETQYISLATSDSGGLYSLNEQLSIDIPQNVLLKDILNLPRNISKKKIIELLSKNGLSVIFDNLSGMSLRGIIEVINNITIEEVLNRIGDQDRVNYLKFIDSKSMKTVYEKYFVNTKGSKNIGRDVYEYIISKAEDDLCPYCLHGTVKTVDHYLPKAYFISYAVTPINLLPCCSDCNKNKKDIRDLTANKMFINPYFDNINDLNWLECKLIENQWPITFKYNVKEDIENEILKKRLEMQFESLELGTLYASNAVRYFRGRVKLIVEEYESGNEEAPIQFLISSKESMEIYNLNAWQAKVYEALLNSDWFLVDAINHLREYYHIEDKGVPQLPRLNGVFHND